jgi:hypothetical protein
MLYPANPSPSIRLAFLKRTAKTQDRILRRQARDHEANLKQILDTMKITGEQISRLEAQLRLKQGELAPQGSSVGFNAFWAESIHVLLEDLEGVLATNGKKFVEEKTRWKEQKREGEAVLNALKREIYELEGDGVR